MHAPPKSQQPDWRHTPEVQEAAHRFTAIIERTLEHVTAERPMSAMLVLSPMIALRVLAGIPTEHLRATIISVARVRAYLSDDGSAAMIHAKAELELLHQFWTDGWKR